MSSLCPTAMSFSLLFALLFVSHLTQSTLAQKSTEISPYMTAEVAVIHQPYAPFSGGFFDSHDNFFFTLGDSSYLCVTDLLGTNVKVWPLISPDYAATPFTLNSKLMGGTVAGNKVYGVFARNNVAGESVILSLDMSSPNLTKRVHISSVFSLLPLKRQARPVNHQTLVTKQAYPLGEVIVSQVLSSSTNEALYILAQEKGKKYDSFIIRFDTAHQAMHRDILPIAGKN